jgi:uncharacterized protein (TIGR02646 family)
MDAMVVRRSAPQRASYSEYREDLRIDFWFACAYCTICESEAAGIAFAIDHYEPQAARPDLSADYANLMWSCQQCNRYKSDVNPGPADRDEVAHERQDLSTTG